MLCVYLTEKLKMEFEANTILLKHEITSKTEALEKITKEQQKLNETNKELQQQLQEITTAVWLKLKAFVNVLIILSFIFAAQSAHGGSEPFAGATQFR